MYVFISYKESQTNTTSDAYTPRKQKTLLIYINKWLETQTSLELSDTAS